jgi:hypothetical protein
MLANYQEDNGDPYLYEKYDSEQVQQAIEQTDATIQTGIGLAQGLFLAGVQSVSVQSLYAMGTVGMFPVVASSIIPVSVAFGLAVRTVTIDNGISISDIGKFGSGLSLVGILSLSSWRVYTENQKVESVAKLGIDTIKSQLDTYEKRPEKPGFVVDGWVMLAALGVGVVIAAVIKNRRK